MDFYSDKEATIAARNFSSSEYSGTQTHMPYEFDEGLDWLGSLIKEKNLQALKKM